METKILKVDIPYLEKLELNNPNAYLEYWLGYLLHNSHTDLQKALNYYKLALKHGYDEYWIRFHMASLYYELGDLSKTISELERLVIIAPDDKKAAKFLENAKFELKQTNKK